MDIESMPYTKEHKENTRKLILESAFRLFIVKGFSGITINEIMNNCKLTRGAFYAHFSSKSELYSESIKYSANSTNLVKIKPDNVSDRQWLCQLLNGYLSLEHVTGDQPCPLAFLATDINMKNNETKTTYSNTYNGMNKAIMKLTKSYSNCNEHEILSVTAMIIGAVAIARTMNNTNDIIELLRACRKEAGILLGGI